LLMVHKQVEQHTSRGVDAKAVEQFWTFSTGSPHDGCQGNALDVLHRSYFIDT
jgi:hypothetical protein